MRALAFLAWWRLVNSVKRIPKSPRLALPYLLFAVFVGLQVVFYFLARRHGADAGRPGGGIAPVFTPREYVEGGPGALIAAVRGLLILNLFTSVVAALGEGGLFFTPSDVDFLFPAPLGRRAVLFTKMVTRYASMIFTAAYFPLLIGGGLVAAVGVSPAGYVPGIVGVWLFLIATANTTQAVVLRRVSGCDEETGDDAADKRRARLRGALATVISVTVLGGIGFVAYAATGGGGATAARGLRDALRVLNGPALSHALFPVAWASDLFRVAFEGWTVAAWGRLAGLLALAGASLLLLFSRDRDFYEGALDFSQRTAQVQRAVQQGNAGTILSQLARDGKLSASRSVRPLGTGARAVLWKDAVFVARTPARSWWTLAFVAVIPAFSPLLIGQKRTEAGVLFWLVMFTITTSNLFLLGLRDMLRRADITKALPVAPARLLAAELAFSVLQMTALGWVSLTAMALLRTATGPTLAAAFLAFPTLAALILPVQTVVLLLYPAANADAAQSGVSGLLSLLASTLSLAPSILVGAALHVTGAGPLLVAAGVGLTNLASAAVALGVAALVWQRFDPTD